LKTNNLKFFWSLVALQILFALVILLNEVMTIYNRGVGGSFPIEHKSSWLKVIIFCSGALLSGLIIWLLDSRGKLDSLLPSPWLVLILAAFPTLLSTIFSHYLSVIGWCCEHPFSFYFGFPFSYLLGIGSFIHSEMQPYEHYDLLKILNTSQPQVHWKLLPYEFLLDFVFWSNIIFVLFGFAIFLRKKYNFIK
jgi:hypothetical protein